MQLELGLAQRAGGLELQKERYDAIRRRHRRGALAFLAYYTSIRNEDRTTLARFRENVRASIANVSPRELARSFERRLNGEWPTDSGGIADILRVEQCNSPVDIYETVIDLAQEVVRQDELGWLRNDILCLCRELEIPDFRLLKVRIQLGEDGLDLKQLPTRVGDQGDALLQGNLAKTLRVGTTSSTTVIDPWRTIYSALALGHGTASSRRTLRSPKRMLAAAVSAKVPDAGSAYAAFIKSSFNLAGLPSLRGLLDFGIQAQPVPNQPAYQFHIASINSPLVGTEDLSAQCSTSVREHILGSRKGASVEFWDRRSTPNLAHPDLLAFGQAVDLANSGNHDEAADLLSFLVENTASLPLRSMTVVLLLRCLTASGAKKRVVELVASEVANHAIPLDSPSLIEALRGVHFSDIKADGYPLAGIIALDAKRRIVEDDKLASEIRFATKAFLRSTEQRRPSLLLDEPSAYSSTQLVYFLRHVCVPSVLDMTGLFKSSEEVLEERQAICAVLNTVDPTNAEQYETETLAIVHNRRINAGLQIVNKNRVHVDVETITRFATRNFTEDFERYKDLQRAGIGVAENYDEVLREVMNAARQSKLLVFAPENEADTTLVGLVAGIRDEFLNSPNGGLDFFLSKRIRHQSFVGLVRGPLEFEHLVTTRETATSDYRVNEHWLNKFDDIGAADREAIEEAFKKLATAFDELVFDVKDRLFHVRSPERPDGMFDAPLTSSTLLVVRALTSTIDTVDEFARVLCTVFWALVDPSLERAREVIRDKLKMRVSELLDELRATVSTHAAASAALPEFSLAVARTSAEVQRALGDAEAWFNRPDVQQAQQLFSLGEAVDISIESARKLHRAFQPDLDVNIDGELSLSAGDLVFLTDAMFIAFSNIRAYSGDHHPSVEVRCTFDAETETIALEVTNTVQSKMRSREQDERIAVIREQIERGVVGKQVRREGGTGFLKLASVVRQSNKGRLEFGYQPDGRFRLLVVWSLIVIPSEVDHSDALDPAR